MMQALLVVEQHMAKAAVHVAKKYDLGSQTRPETSSKPLSSIIHYREQDSAWFPVH